MTQRHLPLPDLIIGELVVNDIHHICIAPGSRSTPLVLAASRHPKLQIHTHFDERSLSYFALGLAKATRNPVAILTTSGTAGANLYPAIIEAHYSHTPLIILTADRPFELLECGANQAIDQHHLFGHYSHFTTTIPTDVSSTAALTTIDHAIYIARTTPGPVHLNLPFREPFDLTNPQNINYPSTPYVTYSTPKLTAPKTETPNSVYPLICIGAVSKASSQALSIWIAKHNLFTINETPHSQLNLSKFDAILHIGGPFIDTEFTQWLSLTDLPYIHIQEYPTRQNPTHHAQTVITTHIPTFLDNYHPKPVSEQYNLLLKEKQKKESLFLNWAQTQTDLSEPTIIHSLHTTLSPHTIVFCANSLPIRALNRWGTHTYSHLYTNRGASGIEGNLATVAGLATAHNEPIVAIIGDQAALHDLNSFAWFQDTHRPVVIIVINNFGGAIFTHLPIATRPECDTLFYRKHNLSFEQAAAMFGIPYIQCQTPHEFTQHLQTALQHPGPTVIEALCPNSTALFKAAKELYQ